MIAHPFKLLTQALLSVSNDTKTNTIKRAIAISNGAAKKNKLLKIWNRMISTGQIQKTPSKKFALA